MCVCVCKRVELMCAQNKFPIYISRSHLIENRFHTCKSVLYVCLYESAFVCWVSWVTVVLSYATHQPQQHYARPIPFLSRMWTVNQCECLWILYFPLCVHVCVSVSEWVLNIRVRNAIVDWQNDDVEQRWLLLPLLQLPFEFKFQANAIEEKRDSLMIN